MKAPRTCRILVLAAVILRATSIAAWAGNAHAAACAACHKDVVRSFAGNPHSRPTRLPGREDEACENCHGPGKAHAENGAVSLIFDPARATAKNVDEKCQKCHEARRSHSEHSVHGKGNVSCIGCHVIHADGAPKYLLRMEQPELCFQCHSEVKPQFSMPFRHKVQEGLINCTDCHDVHGALGENSLPSATWQFMVCTKCHVPAAGPFLYEHAAVKAEGCLACHYPHGGSNPGLLIEANVNTICLRCHLPTPDSETAVSAVPDHVQTARSKSCTNCHGSIHGSNISAVFLYSKQAKNEP
jgi:DmsE family decaheme c-type cytochrome